MAVRSSVLSPPPGPRATVVVRAGPPPRTGRKDLLVGLVGLLLLLSTVGMAVALPHKDVLPQQFKVAYADEPHDLTSQTFAFKTATAQQHDFLYNITDDDVSLVTVKYEFIDDVPASLPDQFSLQLYDPQGNAVGPEVLAVNPPAVPNYAVDQGQAKVASDYTAVRLDAQFSVSNPKPSDDILDVQDQHVTEAQLAAQLEAKAHLDTHGTWKLRVTLVSAGGCPNPQDGPDAANRRLICEQELQATGSPQDVAAGTDPGNPFTVGVFSYSRFVPDVQKIG